MPRSALVVVAAVLPMFNLPEAGVLLIMGIDHFLDMGRTATNVLGNAIATTVVANGRTHSTFLTKRKSARAKDWSQPNRPTPNEGLPAFS